MSNGSEVVVIEPHAQEVSLGTLQADTAVALLTTATAMATALAGVIERQKLYTNIGGRSHVRVEGWTTLATMLGCTPREVANEALADGSYVATVELVRMRDGAVISRATSECGMDEPTWASRARYARRSMAATRATGKACRLAFSWIMALAGYDPTPAEEMPHAEPARDSGGDLARHAPRRSKAAPKVAKAADPESWLGENCGFKSAKKLATTEGELEMKDLTWRLIANGSKGGRRHSWLCDTLTWAHDQDDPGPVIVSFIERAPIVIGMIEDRG